MTEFKIVDASPVALAVPEPKEKKEEVKYPFDALLTGKSFVVPISEDLNVEALRNQASRAAKRMGCKFRVIKHGEPHNCYEVARVG